MIAGGVDIAVIGMLMIANIAVYYQISGPYSLWYLTELIVIIADVLLILGAMNNNPGLILVWLIISMINIVFLFMGWIAVPVMAWLTYVGDFFCNTKNWTDWTNWQGQNLEDVTNAAETGCKYWNQIIAMIWVDLAFVVILPVYYIYLWVAVKSHRENLVRGVNVISPIE